MPVKKAPNRRSGERIAIQDEHVEGSGFESRPVMIRIRLSEYTSNVKAFI